MKKNLLSIIIIALCAINVIFSAVIVFAVVPALSKTNALVTQVSSILDLELESPDQEGGETISVEDIISYNIEKELRVNLKLTEGDPKPHYAAMNVSLSLNTKAEDYEKLNPTIATNEAVILDMLASIFANYTAEEVIQKSDEIKQTALTQLREYFGSDFIINVSFSNRLVQ